jgi:subtilisin family serine protease
LVLAGWTSAGAATPAPAPDTAPVRVTIVVDDNGAAPGGIEITSLQVAADRVGPVTDRLEDLPGVLHAELDSRVAVASDPLTPQQYSAARVRADLVSDEATGDGIVVAVVDSGVRGDHPDLATPLPGGRPRVLPGTTFLTPSPGKPNLTGNPGSVDPNGHGTHVAGIIAAASDNGIGVAGIAPESQILPVRALDANGMGWTSDVAAGILWAHQQGADVINLSLAGPGSSAAVSTAIDTVTTDTSRGTAPTIVVAAAGNSGTAYSKMWPAAHPRVIAVASSDSTDTVAATSSRGTYVDVAAPGVSILSTCIPTTYCKRSGTSMAAPLVAGAAALLREQDPNRDGEAVESILEGTAYDIDRLGEDTASGWGRVDLAAALDPGTFTQVPRRLPTGVLEVVRVDDRRISVRGRATDVDGNGNPKVRIESVVGDRRSLRTTTASGGRFSLEWSDVPGTHLVCATALDIGSSATVPLGCNEVVVK